METLEFVFAGGMPPSDRTGHALVGVVGSGNLEVLIEPADAERPHGGRGQYGGARLSATRGRRCWSDFHARHPLGDVALPSTMSAPRRRS